MAKSFAKAYAKSFIERKGCNGKSYKVCIFYYSSFNHDRNYIETQRKVYVSLFQKTQRDKEILFHLIKKYKSKHEQKLEKQTPPEQTFSTNEKKISPPTPKLDISKGEKLSEQVRKENIVAHTQAILKGLKLNQYFDQYFDEQNTQKTETPKMNPQKQRRRAQGND